MQELSQAKSIIIAVWPFGETEQNSQNDNYFWSKLQICIVFTNAQTTVSIIKFRYCDKATKFEENLPPFYEITL